MNIEEFNHSITNATIPANLSLPLQALWHDKMGDWTKAHDLIDSLNDKSSAHVHAYLHRKEGDIWNADYWYSRAGKKRPNLTLDQEWTNLVQLMLANSASTKLK